MISFTVESKAVDRLLQNLPQAIKNEVGDYLRTVTGPAVNQKFKEFAPKSSGDLSESGTVQVDTQDMTMQFVAGKGLRGMRTGFPYPLWVAGEIPTIRTRNPANNYFKAGQTIQYGMSADSPSGIPIDWSASPRWWRGVQEFTNRKFPQDVRVAVGRALKRK